MDRTNTPTPVERVYFAWDDALSRNDKAALLALYADDAVIESPLIPHVLKSERGIVRGAAEIRALLDEVAARKPPARQFHRTGYLTDGRRLIWEYPRETPDGEQMDFVYWGWYGVRVIQRDQYHR